ncbi:MAG: hypothetical protein R3C26_19365 [Calditrichia bacterium]
MTIFSIAHLSDAERMFFTDTAARTNAQLDAGTIGTAASAHCCIWFRVFAADWRTAIKKPLLTIVETGAGVWFGRGAGCKNPVDLDYKELSNTSTWFIGRLQTERDQDRLIDGLTSASGGRLNKVK